MFKVMVPLMIFTKIEDKADGVSDMADVAAAASDNAAMDGAEKIVGGEAVMAVILREIWLFVLGCSGIRAPAETRSRRRGPKTTTTHSRDFWAVRAEVLHQLFPDVEPLELILFTASSTNVVLMGAGEGQSQRV